MNTSSAGARATVVVVPCSAAKAPTAKALPARSLYVGPYHLLCRRAAEAITGVDGVVVLSALYGFVTLDQHLSPYELRMGQPGSVQPDRLRAQADDLGLLCPSRRVIALGGRAYVEAVAGVRPDALRPLAGCRGIGEQRSRLTRIAAAEHPLALAMEYDAGCLPNRLPCPSRS